MSPFLSQCNWQLLQVANDEIPRYAGTVGAGSGTRLGQGKTRANSCAGGNPHYNFNSNRNCQFV